ncbi:hypothetical protein B0181_04470 [Moraxella caviae]|uniref:SGNH hydrolase-type esterase domain-containing protein n=1 Tax=Moraxella caviae TaxID=34060 RepID=A0A1T0A5A1_9GAMM|nr:SGNH/GDSL hydrolase family protein [Moraxella caviae]OOR90850.1 hypothetical protein B0181_04470 [Moraxella caviae]STZ10685.1 Uncharacterised protein [Moraxella caviae]VEW10854.1 Uncharacterised protein [Moraxella caviae]
MFHKKYDYLLAPLYYYQAKNVAKTALRLPEPEGVRLGNTPLFNTPLLGAPLDADTQNTKTLRLTIFGDSAAAGVGVDTQADAPLGRIVANLAQIFTQNSADNTAQNTPYQQICWQLCATSGHTSFQLLHRLYAMPAPTSTPALNVAIISIGVNDVVKRTSDTAWQHNLRGIITLLKRKFGVGQILFLSLPPMQLAPSLPTPLNALIGRQAQHLSTLMQGVCAEFEGVHYVRDEFAKARLSRDVMFAKDGFHPSKLTYEVWSKTLANQIAALV